MNELINIQPFHCILLLLLLFLTQLPLSRSCHDDERAALLTFKSFLTDPSNRLSSWKVGQNCCEWHGIQCSHDSLHVIALDLHNDFGPYSSSGDDDSLNYDNLYNPQTELNGTISPSLFNLTHLQYLDLSFNNFQSSQYPHQFANLKRLTHLDLSYSRFSGSITTQFSNLSSLRYLDISGEFYSPGFTYVFSTNLKTSTDWVRGLVNLHVLRMGGVDLYLTKNWAEPISFLADLREFHLSDCNISTLFPIREFLNLSHLSSLRMNGNPFFDSSIPIQLANLTSLSVLELSFCNLRGSIPYLPQLKELDVSSNHFLEVNLTRMFEHQWPKLQELSISSTNVNGSIPMSISNASLVNLFASWCSITGSLPTSVLNLSRLQYLDFSENYITGFLPSSFSNFSRLQHLYLSDNEIRGPIPGSICEVMSLRSLDLGKNKLTGTIPSCITKLQNLRTFKIDGNSIGGNISLIVLINELNLTRLNLNSNKITVEIDRYLLPTKFQLRTLGLQSCDLKGYIPSFICNLTHLDTLDLSRNNLTGDIPTCLFGLQNLVDLDLSQNNLQGKLPYFLPRSLSTLNLSSNNLAGPVPLPPTNISTYDLSQNKFNGEISIKTGKRLSTANFVSLSGNRLSGSIPFSICSSEDGLLFPTSLDLSNNQLSGSIPSSLGYCSSLIYLHLGMNNLTGNIPIDFEQARSVEYLLLNDNFLNGSFPDSIRQLYYLEVLNLGNNNFGGIIPTFIGSLSNLKILFLRSNAFNGSIPEDISNMYQLQMLDVSLNNLSGPIPRKLGNLKMLTSRPDNGFMLWDYIYHPNPDLEMVIKGMLVQLERVYSYSSGIDLSCNMLEGNIPKEMGLLKGLAMLNLSHNHLSGKIPTSIGNMTGLDSLDLSFNKLSGHIPQSLTKIDSLGYLNLSYNNLSGMIPGGPHFESLSLDGSAYIGNPLLCGIPTNKSCEGDVHSPTGDSVGKDEDDAREKLLFYGFVVLGFGVGFWGLFLVLLIKKDKWWFGYWRFVDNVAVRMASCMRKK